MITKNELIEQLLNKPFKEMMFTPYNLIEDEGFVIEASGKDKETYGINDFEYLQFTLDADDKKAIKSNKKDIMTILTAFKYHIEKVCQPLFAYCRIYIMKEIGVVIAVKLKKYDIKELLIS